MKKQAQKTAPQHPQQKQQQKPAYIHKEQHHQQQKTQTSSVHQQTQPTYSNKLSGSKAALAEKEVRETQAAKIEAQQKEIQEQAMKLESFKVLILDLLSVIKEHLPRGAHESFMNKLAPNNELTMSHA